jgi:hypothetical protein
LFQTALHTGVGAQQQLLEPRMAQLETLEAKVRKEFFIFKFSEKKSLKPSKRIETIEIQIVSKYNGENTRNRKLFRISVVPSQFSKFSFFFFLLEPTEATAVWELFLADALGRNRRRCFAVIGESAL